MPSGQYPSRSGLEAELTFEVNGNMLSHLKLKDYSVSWNPMHETGQRGGALLSKVAKGIAFLIDKGMPMLSMEYRWADPACIRSHKPTELEIWLSGTKLIVLDGSRFISQLQLDSFPCSHKKGNDQCKGIGLKAGEYHNNARSSKVTSLSRSSLTLIIMNSLTLIIMGAGTGHGGHSHGVLVQPTPGLQVVQAQVPQP
jgi:hypothetical protein